MRKKGSHLRHKEKIVKKIVLKKTVIDLCQTHTHTLWWLSLSFKLWLIIKYLLSLISNIILLLFPFCLTNQTHLHFHAQRSEINKTLKIWLQDCTDCWWSARPLRTRPRRILPRKSKKKYRRHFRHTFLASTCTKSDRPHRERQPKWKVCALLIIQLSIINAY